MGIIRDYLGSFLGLKTYENKITSLEETIKYKSQIIGITAAENRVLLNTIKQIVSHEKQSLSDVNKKWYETGLINWSYVLASNVGGVSLQKDMKSISKEYKHRARDVINTADFVKKGMTLNKAKQKVLSERGESFRHFKMNNQGDPYK